jgi:AMP deaminase
MSTSLANTMSSGMGDEEELEEPHEVSGPRVPVEMATKKHGHMSMVGIVREEVALGIKAMEKKQMKPIPTFSRCDFRGEGAYDEEKKEVAQKFLNCLKLRKKFVWMPSSFDHTEYEVRRAPVDNPAEVGEIPENLPLQCKFIKGVMHVFDASSVSTQATTDGMDDTADKPKEADKDASEKKEGSPSTTTVAAFNPSAVFDEADSKYTCPTWQDYCDALTYLVMVGTNGPCKSWSHSRLTILETQKRLHSLMNHELELAQSKAVPHRDFYNVRKIDNHVHHSACMNQKHMLRYIKKKIRCESAQHRPVISRDGKLMTLQEVFQSLNLTAYDLSIDTLDMHATQTFQRFDKFNLKYNPIGESRLREIFLKYNNYIKGEYLAEITREVFDDLESNKYQFAEYRMSIYGRQRDEWDKLADWIIDNKLWSPNVRWMVQIPRLYSVYKKAGLVNSLQDMLDNIFIPMFEATINPQANPRLHHLLKLIVGFDCVDDESIRTKFFDSRDPSPEDWDQAHDPHYCAFLYYLYANLQVLNQLREARGMTTFTLRPHAGEAGDIEHIASSFLCAHSINHGLTLLKSTPLQYLYYLSQSGISMSPLSNNLLFLEYQKNPFPKYFSRGLNVALSSDDPLLIHVTKEPLVEEYSVASQVWKLSHIDMCEIARNSVLQSGFEQKFKVHWLGNHFWERTVQGNDIRCSNVPDIRIQFRWEMLHKEHSTLATFSGHPLDLSLIDPLY